MHPIDHGFRAHFFVWRGRLNRMRHFKRQVAALALYCAVLALLILVLDTLEPYMQYDMTGYVYGGDAPAVPEHDDNPYARTDTAPKE